MSEEALSPEENHKIAQYQQGKQLLQRQQHLQDEAQHVLRDLNAIELLSNAGTLRQVGSSTLGLMVWRDIDLAISSPGLETKQAFEIMQPLLTHPYVKHVRYFQQSGRFREEDSDERYFFMLYYQRDQQPEWKLDISFWLGEGLHPEPVHEQIEQELTPETRLIILRIKDVWYQLPAYRQQVASTDIYDAVLQHNIKTLPEFDDYLAQRGKPTRTGMPLNNFNK